DAVEAGAREQRGKRARAAAEIDHPRAAWKAGQLDERVDQARARLRREHVVVVRGGVAVEERNLLLLVLCFILRRGGHVLGCSVCCLTCPSTGPTLVVTNTKRSALPSPPPLPPHLPRRGLPNH